MTALKKEDGQSLNFWLMFFLPNDATKWRAPKWQIVSFESRKIKDVFHSAYYYFG